MYIKLILIFVIVVDLMCSGESLDSKTRPKRLMPIDVSKLGHSFSPLHGLSFHKPLVIAGNNQQFNSNSVPKPLNIDLSALKLQQDIGDKSTTAAPNTISQASDETKDYWNDINQIENDNKVYDFEEYDYLQSLRMPNNIHYNIWSPETPGYDALTDFLHEEYKTGGIVSNGKRDYDLYPTEDWVDNEIPILPDIPPPKSKHIPCSYRLLKDYGISCSQLIALFAPPIERNGNHIIKRNMFLSKGWGPSGSYIHIPKKLETSVMESKANLKKLISLAKAEQVLHKNEARSGNMERPDTKQAVNSRRWSVPHLFGSY